MPRLTSSELARLALEARLGRIDASKFQHLPLLIDVCGQRCSLKDVRPRRVAICPRGLRAGVVLHRRKVFVLSDETIRRFRFGTAYELIRWLDGMDIGTGITLVEVDELARCQTPTEGDCIDVKGRKLQAG